MALVSVNGLKVSWTLSDKGGNKSTLRYTLNPAVAEFVDLATASSAAGLARLDAARARLEAVTDANVISQILGQYWEEDDQANEYGAGEVEELAIITGRIDGYTKKSHSIRIPAPSDGIFMNDAAPGPEANQIDTNDAALLAWMASFQATTGAAAGDFLVSDGESMTDVTPTNIKGKRIHRGSTKG